MFVQPRNCCPGRRKAGALHAQAWEGGLQYFLSTDPPEQLVDSVADTLSQSTDGAVVVRAHNGSQPLPHGPALAFYPSVINMSPGRHNATFSY